MIQYTTSQIMTTESEGPLIAWLEENPHSDLDCCSSYADDVEPWIRYIESGFIPKELLSDNCR